MAGRLGPKEDMPMPASPRPRRARKAVRFITRDDHRLYIHPVTGEYIPGVTSTIDNLPKPYLRAWSQKLVAEEAVNKFDQLERLRGANEDAAVKWLKEAPNRVTRKSAREGKIAHGYMEDQALGLEVDTSKEDPAVVAMVAHHKHFMDTLHPEAILLEEGIWSERHDYAGTFDAVMRFDCPDIMVRDSEGNERPLVGIVWLDNKTTRSGVHPEVGLQLAAYRFAEYLLREDGTVVKNNPGDFAMVLHVRPEGWELVPVEAGPEELKVFLHLRAITDYTRTHSNKIIHAPVAGNRIARKRRSASAETMLALDAA